ncbi:MAG: hypothetical protein ACE5JK_02150, partial [Candidatus Omnitrophota bacterium]
MLEQKSKYNCYIKAIAMAVAFIFTLNTLVWANPDIFQKGGNNLFLSPPNVSSTEWYFSPARLKGTASLVANGINEPLPEIELQVPVILHADKERGIELKGELDFEGKRKEKGFWVVPFSLSDKTKWEVIFTQDKKAVEIREVAVKEAQVRKAKSKVDYEEALGADYVACDMAVKRVINPDEKEPAAGKVGDESSFGDEAESAADSGAKDDGTKGHLPAIAFVGTGAAIGFWNWAMLFAIVVCCILYTNRKAILDWLRAKGYLPSLELAGTDIKVPAMFMEGRQPSHVSHDEKWGSLGNITEKQIQGTIEAINAGDIKVKPIKMFNQLRIKIGYRPVEYYQLLSNPLSPQAMSLPDRFIFIMFQDGRAKVVFSKKVYKRFKKEFRFNRDPADNRLKTALEFVLFRLSPARELRFLREAYLNARDCRDVVSRVERIFSFNTPEDIYEIAGRTPTSAGKELYNKIEPINVTRLERFSLRWEKYRIYLPLILFGAFVVSLSFLGVMCILTYLCIIFPPPHWLGMIRFDFMGMAALFGIAFAAIITPIVYELEERNKRIAFESLFVPSDFREEFDKSSYARNVMKKIRTLGINGNWDNPDYRKSYYTAPVKGVAESDSYRAQVVYARKIMKRFLGVLEGEKVKDAGDLFKTLKRDRKQKAKEFHLEHKEGLEALYRGEIERKRLIGLFEVLKDIVAAEEGMAHIEQVLAAFREKDPVLEKIDARIWRRDPWYDLSDNAELNACVWLYGTCEDASMAFIRNKTVTMLDLYSEGEHLARVELAAAVYTVNGKKYPILVVPCMSGDKDLSPEMNNIIKRAIEDYAKACGFPYVFYNKHVVNKMPKNFIGHLGKKKLEEAIFPIAFADTSKKLYVELFIKRGKLAGKWLTPEGIVEGYFVKVGRCRASPSDASRARYHFMMARRRFAKAAVLTGLGAIFGRYVIYPPHDIQRYKYSLSESASSSERHRAIEELTKIGTKEAHLVLAEAYDSTDYSDKDRIFKAVAAYCRRTQDRSFKPWFFGILEKSSHPFQILEELIDDSGVPIWQGENESLAKRLLAYYRKTDEISFQYAIRRLIENKNNQFSNPALLDFYLEVQGGISYYTHSLCGEAKDRLAEKRRTAEDNDLLIETYEEMRKEEKKKQMKLLRSL